MAINTVDRSNNPITLITNQPTSPGSQHAGVSTPVDAGTGALASVAAFQGAANMAPPASNNNGLMTGAIALLQNPAGKLDAQLEVAADTLPARGIPAELAMVGTRTTATSTTTVSSGSASATLSIAATSNFVVGGIMNFEPGTSRYPDSAVITAVVANTSVTVAFPTGGAVSTHTANYTVETFTPSVAREAPGRQGAILVSSDGTKPTYRAGGTGNTLYSTASAVLLEVQGSASKTVRLKHIELWGKFPSASYTELQLLRCTGLSGSGSPTAANNGLHDTNDAAATAVVNFYTGAATSGAGHLVDGAKMLPSLVGGLGAAVWDFSRSQDKAMVLRGTGDVIELYNTITGLGTGTFGFEVEWEEDNS